MKKIFHIIIAITVILGLNGCASSKAYLVNRGRDAADIFTATIGLGVGVKARGGPLQTGLLAQSDLVGLRGGTFPFVYDRNQYEIFPTIDLQAVYCGVEQFDADGYLTANRYKDFETQSMIPIYHTDSTPCPYYYTQIDVVVALGPSIRLGCNPGEFLDFLLGWGTIDIFNDDIEINK
jgi:hypothetical protein